GDVGEVEGRGSGSPDRARLEEHGPEEREVRVDSVPVAEGEPRRDEGAREGRARRNRDALAVAERALAPRRGVELVAQRGPDDRRGEARLVARGDRDAPERKTGDVVGGPVERVHDPGVRAAGSRERASLLPEERVLGKARADRREDRRLALAVRAR